MRSVIPSDLTKLDITGDKKLSFMHKKMYISLNKYQEIKFNCMHKSMMQYEIENKMFLFSCIIRFKAESPITMQINKRKPYGFMKCNIRFM